MAEKRPNTAIIGLNLNSTLRQIRQGQLSYALNAQIESFDGNSVTYQNEQGNEFCVNFPAGYQLIGAKNFMELKRVVIWLANPTTGDSEIGYVDESTCTYTTFINDKCLAFDINFPIFNALVRKTNCTAEVYWSDAKNRMRFIDFYNPPYLVIKGGVNCQDTVTTQIDCNRLNVQPSIATPSISYKEVGLNGKIKAGTVQFAVQYANSLGDAYTSFFSVTNPLSIFDPLKVTPDFNYETTKSVTLTISNIDISGVYTHINVAVVETINNISTPYLINTYKINKNTLNITYTGEHSGYKLSMEDIFNKYPIYKTAQGIFALGDRVGWYGLSVGERINYQKIANKIKLQWQSHRLPSPKGDNYSKGVYTANTRGYMRDEVYPFEFVPVLKYGGELGDGFHIPGRSSLPSDLAGIINKDSQTTQSSCNPDNQEKPTWKVYNTAIKKGVSVKPCSATSVTPVPTTPTVPAVLRGTISLSCSDGGCAHQGNISATFKFNTPLAKDLQLYVGQIRDVGNAGFLRGVGYNLFGPLPQGVLPDPYYLQWSQYPFILTIPAGSTSYTVNEPIVQVSVNNSRFNTWICQGCMWPIKNIYLKAVDGTQIKFTTTQSYVLTNLNEPIKTDYTPNPNPTPAPGTPSGPCLDDCYNGPYEYGDFAYWESTELYPCDPSIWGSLAGQPIRHHKFPDSTVSKIHDDQGNIYPIGVRIDVDAVKKIIQDSDLTPDQKANIVGFKIVRGNRSVHASITAKGLITNVGKYDKSGTTYLFPNYGLNDLHKDPFLSTGFTDPNSGSNSGTLLDAFSSDDSRKRFCLHSPDTSFYQPSLGNILKLETLEYGDAKGHFVEVEKHAKYKFMTGAAYGVAAAFAVILAVIPTGAGTTVTVAGPAAALTGFQLVIDIIQRLIPRKSMAHQFNTIGNYTKSLVVPNSGNKQRAVDIASYILSGYQSAGDQYPINNFQRESSVYLRTVDILPHPTENFPTVAADSSKWLLSANGCSVGAFQTKPTCAYYASLKREIANQYGTLTGYEVIDTGFYQPIDWTNSTPIGFKTVFGGDTYINKFAYKSKFPFFTDNRVGFPDEADIFYDAVPNVAHPIYWISTDVRGTEGSVGGLFGSIGQIFGVKATNLDCTSNSFFYKDGKFYLFAYGIPYFFCESTINVDARQAFNGKEGDFYPHVGSDVPDNWLQEANVSIQQDNTYYYNQTFSKQNKETNFTHLPEDYRAACFTTYPNKVIYSDPQEDIVNYQRNNWLLYKPSAQSDFPNNYGALVDVRGLENRQVLARFENKSLLYNVLYTAPTNTGEIYLGKDLFPKSTPPLDFADTDTGWNGTQHHFFLKTQYGHISVDAKRGQVFLISGRQSIELTNKESGMTQFFTENLGFEIQKSFPTIPIDNHFNKIGLHGIFDPKYNRLILTKLDYSPLYPDITYVNGKFYRGTLQINVDDPAYFCNRSFTASYDFDEKAWISLHSYLPHFYIGAANFFYSGMQTVGLWRHDTASGLYNNFYGVIHPYVLEYPFAYQNENEILQAVQDYSKVNQYTDKFTFVQTDNAYFTKALIYNDQQCSGIRKLTYKQRNNLYLYGQYPKYNLDNIEILYTKSNNFYNYNSFYDIVKDHTKPFITKSCKSVSYYKDIDPTNLDYTNRSFKRAPISAKDCRIRHILDDRSDIRISSQFIITETQISYK